jgi:lipoyl(octanoyl) transferase
MNIIDLGLQDYAHTWQLMKDFTARRQIDTEDELWIVQHLPVFTQGISGKREHELNLQTIEVIKTDRGGQITYHAPGQLIIYCLLDLKRLNLSVKKMVSILEQSIIQLLKSYQIEAHLQKNAPGVYVNHAKIAALGLKIKHGKTYHGLSLNIDMDLTPFSQINPCGYAGLSTTQMSDLADNVSLSEIAQQLTQILSRNVTRN